MHDRLSVFVRWPERDQLIKTMPMEFRKHFKKCAVIIDCFEIYIECPTSLTARAQTWLNYKKHNTVKFLIGITPQGSVSFISKGWGGRVSDVHLMEHNGLLKNLLPGDVILADRGFTIQDSAGFYCAEVKIPAFTRGKKTAERNGSRHSKTVGTRKDTCGACDRCGTPKVYNLTVNTTNKYDYV